MGEMNSPERVQEQHQYEDFHDGGINTSMFFSDDNGSLACTDAVVSASPCSGGGGGEGDEADWIQGIQDEDLLDDNSSLFYSDFPALPDFPCMSTSSSSSSTPAPVKGNTPSSSSSSSAASWAILKSEVEEVAEGKCNQDQDSSTHKDCQDQHNSYGYYNDQSQSLPATLFATTTSMEGVQQCYSPPDSLLQSQPSDYHQVEETLDCMDMMESFGYMDLLENNEEYLDPSAMFYSDEDERLLQELNYNQLDDELGQQQLEHVTLSPRQTFSGESIANNGVCQERKGNGTSEDLAAVFLEWLRNNKETVSAEDLRRVKIKKSTIESAANRLGGGKDGMKQLLKLILEWVQTNHLKRRSITDNELPSSSSNDLLTFEYPREQLNIQNPNPNPAPPPHAYFNSFDQSPWMAQPYAPADNLVPAYPSMGGGCPFANGSSCNFTSHGSYNQTPVEYSMMGSPQAQWQHGCRYGLVPNYASYPENNLLAGPPPPNPQYTGYGNQYYYHQPCLQVHGGSGQSTGGDPGLVKMCSSATKEARKKRMARQRRFLSHHRSQHNSHNCNNQTSSHSIEPNGRIEGDACNISTNSGPSSPGKWISWQQTKGGGPISPALSGDASLDRFGKQTQNFQKQLASDRRQGWKTEKNLKFLLQKVLKQSDVGNLGRIVLPKKEAETHLPELEARDGISLAMEDIGTSRVWNMRYRFWPNNKSRMYLLENTGDFVRANGLQEGDFIVIYSDMKSGKYLIRGVKVRQAGQKIENKRPTKSQKKGHDDSPEFLISGTDSPTSTPVI